MAADSTENLNQQGIDHAHAHTVQSSAYAADTPCDGRSEEFVGHTRTLNEKKSAEFDSATAELNAALKTYGILNFTRCRYHVSETESVAAIRAQTELAHSFGARRARQRADGELPPPPGHKDE